MDSFENIWNDSRLRRFRHRAFPHRFYNAGGDCVRVESTNFPRPYPRTGGTVRGRQWDQIGAKFMYVVRKDQYLVTLVGEVKELCLEN